MSKDKLTRTLKTPGKLTHRLAKTARASVYHPTGIIVLYAGFVAVSDANGQVIFPRRNHFPSVKYMVTQHIRPVFTPTVDMPNKTVLKWQLTKPERTKYYTTELKQDAEIQMHYWKTTEQKIPKNNTVPDDTLVIYADPTYITVPVGPVSIAANSPHFMLPDVYVDAKITEALAAIKFLKISKYFSLVPLKYTFDTLSYSTLIAA